MLVVDDGAGFRRSLVKVLAAEGFSAAEAADGREALAAARRDLPDLVILDLVMPGMGGVQVCRELKGDPTTAGIPILILTGNDRDGQEVACLDLGADDYLIKPVRTARLTARCRALLRRAHGGGPGPARDLSAGDMRLEHARKAVIVGGREFLHLTPKEFAVLYALAAAAPEPRDRAALYREVWGMDPASPGVLRTVEVHVRRIRLKLGWRAHERLVNVVGRGYRLEPRL